MKVESYYFVDEECRRIERRTAMRRISCLALTMIMIMVSSVPAFATTYTYGVESADVYVSDELNAKYERTVSETGIVTVTVKSLTDDSVLATLQNINGNIYLDGTLIQNASNLSTRINTFGIEGRSLQPFASSTISWGNWSVWETLVNNYPTGGISMAILYGVVAAACPWVSFRVISSTLGVIAASYDYITVKMRIRYGNDGNLYYYQRQTAFYGDNVLIDTFEDMGSEPL